MTQSVLRITALCLCWNVFFCCLGKLLKMEGVELRWVEGRPRKKRGRCGRMDGWVERSNGEREASMTKNKEKKMRRCRILFHLNPTHLMRSQLNSWTPLNSPLNFTRPNLFFVTIEGSSHLPSFGREKTAYFVPFCRADCHRPTL